MNLHPCFIGCDISKDHLDLFDAGTGRSDHIPNTPEALAPLLAEWRDRQAQVLFEATGSYDRCLRQALLRAGVPFARVNPARARDFARACGTLAKTDAIDARMLARMGAALHPACQAAPSPDREALARLHKRRDQLVLMRKQEKTRLRDMDDPLILEDIEENVAALTRRITAMERHIATLTGAAKELAEEHRLLRSLPGIGPVAATTLLALMPELGTRSPKAIAALAGLAPFNRDSGKFRGQRTIKGGRRRVRQALYMAALSAIRSKHRFARTYKAMIDAGKPPKLALIAIARKLIVTANAILRDRTMFQT